MTKKRLLLAITLLFILTALPLVSFAETVQGTLKSVDTGRKKMEVDSARGISWVVYTSSTKWPAGTTDPSSLVGKTVRVDKDDLLEEAVSVEEA